MYPMHVLYDGQLTGTTGPGSEVPNVVIQPQPVPQWGITNSQTPMLDQAISMPGVVPVELTNIVRYKPSIPPWLQHKPIHLPHQHVPVQYPDALAMSFGQNAIHYQWIPQPYQSIENAAITMAYVPLQHGPTAETYFTPMRPNLHQANIAVPSDPIHSGRPNHSNANIGRFNTNRQINVGTGQLKIQTSHANSPYTSPGSGSHKTVKIPITQIRHRSCVTIQQKHEQEMNQYLDSVKMGQTKHESDVNRSITNRIISISPLKNAMTIPKQALQDSKSRPNNCNESIRTVDLNPYFDDPQWKGRSHIFPIPYSMGHAGLSNADCGPTQNSTCPQVLKITHRTPPWLSKNVDFKRVNGKEIYHLKDTKESSTLDVGSKRKIEITDIDKRPTCKVVPTDKIRLDEQVSINDLSTDLYKTTEKSAKKIKIELDERVLQIHQSMKMPVKNICVTKKDVKLENEENGEQKSSKVSEVNSETLNNKISIIKPTERLNIKENTEKAHEHEHVDTVKREKILQNKLNETKDIAIVIGNAVSKKTQNEINVELPVSKTTKDQNQSNVCINHNLNEIRTKNTILTHVISGILIRESRLPFKDRKNFEPDATTHKHLTQEVKFNSQSLKDSFISKKDSTLTHVIDGLIIQESDYPFQVGKPRWLTKQSETCKTKTCRKNDNVKPFLDNNQTLYLTMTESDTDGQTMVKKVETEIVSKHPAMLETSSETSKIDSPYLKKGNIIEVSHSSKLKDETLKETCLKLGKETASLTTLTSELRRYFDCRILLSQCIERLRQTNESAEQFSYSSCGYGYTGVMVELQRHLRQRWCECMASLQHDEVDGRALRLACAEQLEGIGVCAPHARALCAFAEGVTLAG